MKKLLVLLLLTACASQPGQPVTPMTDAHKQKVERCHQATKGDPVKHAECMNR